MNIGQLVRYTPNTGEDPLPAIVMKIWEDGAIQLYVFHFESITHVRAAHPSQVEPVAGTEDLLQEIEGLRARVEELESRQEADQSASVTVDAALLPEAEDDPDAVMAGVDATPKRSRRATWPK